MTSCNSFVKYVTSLSFQYSLLPLTTGKVIETQNCGSWKRSQRRSEFSGIRLNPIDRDYLVFCLGEKRENEVKNSTLSQAAKSRCLSGEGIYSKNWEKKVSFLVVFAASDSYPLLLPPDSCGYHDPSKVSHPSFTSQVCDWHSWPHFSSFFLFFFSVLFCCQCLVLMPSFRTPLVCHRNGQATPLISACPRR